MCNVPYPPATTYIAKRSNGVARKDIARRESFFTPKFPMQQHFCKKRYSTLHPPTHVSKTITQSKFCKWALYARGSAATVLALLPHTPRRGRDMCRPAQAVLALVGKIQIMDKQHRSSYHTIMGEDIMMPLTHKVCLRPRIQHVERGEDLM